MNRLSYITRGIAAVALLAASSLATAVPTLQIGIDGGTYDNSTQTIISPGASFTLYAFLNDPSLLVDSNNNPLDYFISASIVPAVSTATNLGSIDFNGNIINVTADMEFGTPPLDPVLDALYGDLPTHGIFPTYFSEFLFNFSASDIASFDLANTQDNPGLTNLNLTASGPVDSSGANGLYYAAFTVDTSSLATGSGIHFDLYNTDIRNCKPPEQTDGCTLTVISTDDFAPFSHDAQSSSSSSGDPSSTGTTIPEPSSVALVLLGLGLLGAGFAARRRA